MKVFDTILEHKRVLGIEYHVSSNGTGVFHIVQLKKERSSISSETKTGPITDLETFFKTWKEKPPVILILNGKGIIHKHISFNDSDDNRTLLGKTIPNAKETDFYMQVSSPFNGKVFVSIARRSVVDVVLEQFKTAKLEVLACCFGPQVMESILPLIESGYQYEYAFSEYKLSMVDGHLDSFMVNQPTSEGIAAIGDEQVPFPFLIPFAAAFCFLGSLPFPIAAIDTVKAQKEENHQKRLFQFTKWSIVGFFLVIMTVNFFVFDRYKNKRQDLEQQMALNKDAIQKLDTLTKEFRQKQDFLERTGLLQASRSSYYADDLGKDLPASITLSGVDINPFQKPKNEEDRISFQNKLMRISGFCSQSLELNNWMEEIKKKSWVKDLTLLNYSQVKGMQNGEFLVQVDIK